MNAQLTSLFNRRVKSETDDSKRETNWNRKKYSQIAASKAYLRSELSFLIQPVNGGHILNGDCFKAMKKSADSIH